jgi:hypothetical protein
MCANAVVGSARRWMSMSPMINIVMAPDPYEPLHFHGASAAARTATTDDTATMGRMPSLFIAILPCSGVD